MRLHDDGFDTLLDAAKALIRTTEASPEASASLRTRWFSSRAATLRRLALWGLASTEHASAWEKVTLLLEQRVLFEWALKPEAFKVLANAYPRLSISERESFVEAAREQFSSRRVQSESDYELYNLWVWLANQAPDDEVARARLASIASSNPDWLPRERPDLSIFTGDWVERPREATRQAVLAVHPAEGNIPLLLEQLPEEDWDHDEALRGVGAARGLDWLSAFAQAHYWRPQTWRPILAGIHQAESFETQLAQLANVLVAFPHFAQIGEFVSRLVERGLSAGGDEGTTDGELNAARLLIKRLWRSARRRRQVMPEPREDALSAAINSEGGALGQATLRLLSEDVRRGGPELGPFYKNQFEWSLRTPGEIPEAVSVICASQLHFLAHLDLRWARDHVVTAMRTENRPRAEAMWHGFLTWGRLADPLRDELWPLFEMWWPLLQEIPDRWRSRFAEYSAALVILASNDERVPNFLRTFARVAPVDVRVEWAEHVGILLGGSTSETQHLVWESWLRSYWSDRVSGIPRGLEPEEIGGMARWPLVLRDHFPEAVDLLAHGGSAHGRLRVYADLVEAEWLDQYPDQGLIYLLHLLGLEERAQFWHCSEARTVLGRLGDRAASTLRLQVEARLAQLGC